jgi:hypothetical protein
MWMMLMLEEVFLLEIVNTMGGLCGAQDLHLGIMGSGMLLAADG